MLRKFDPILLLRQRRVKSGKSWTGDIPGSKDINHCALFYDAGNSNNMDFHVFFLLFFFFIFIYHKIDLKVTSEFRSVQKIDIDGQKNVPLLALASYLL